MSVLLEFHSSIILFFYSIYSIHISLKVPCGIFLQTKKNLFTFCVTHENVLSLQSNKLLNFPPHETFAKLIFLVFWILTSRRKLGVEVSLLRIERSSLSWFGHLIWLPPVRLLRFFWAHEPGGEYRAPDVDNISLLLWKHLPSGGAGGLRRKEV